MRKMWTAGTLLATCLLSFTWALSQDREEKAGAARGDEARLQGTWVGRVVQQPATERAELITVVVRGGHWELKTALRGLHLKGTLTVNPAGDPKQVDLTITEAPGFKAEPIREVALGIYRIGADGTLTVAVNDIGEATHPQAFERALSTTVFEFRKWQPGMILPANPPELKVLETRIGTWTTETVFKPGPWNPTERKVTGTETTEWILGGRVQRTRNANRPANPDSMLLLTYDPQAKVFRSWFFDDQGGHNEMTGKWDEAAQTLNWTAENNGFPIAAATHFVDSDNIDWKLTIMNPDGKIMLEVIGKLVRKETTGAAK
jgi:uncharacterized protein (TIGR03067 family)